MSEASSAHVIAVDMVGAGELHKERSPETGKPSGDRAAQTLPPGVRNGLKARRDENQRALKGE